MLIGSQTWMFKEEPANISTGVVGGPFEAEGKLSDSFDKLHEDLWMGEDSYEKAQKVLLEDAIQIALTKRALKKEDIQIFIAGDLINQITPTTFTARTIQTPYLGIFSACAISTQGLAIGASLINSHYANLVLTGTSSHNASAEKQFRYPTEYGGQKPPTAQWTATGAGVSILSTATQLKSEFPRVTTATIGKVIDMGITDPMNMGGAMAPAAVDTIMRHFADTNRTSEDYDLIITGDLATIGRNVALELFQQKGVHMPEEKFVDCGLLLYDDHQNTFAGGSGPGCSAIVLYGHILNEMMEGKYKRILVVATGALLSPLSFQQNESIPCIAHAVSIERK